MNRPRLMVAGALSENEQISLTENDFLYLTRVMRKKAGDEVIIFNGSDGDFLARIQKIEKKSLTVKVESKIKEQAVEQKIALAFALIKNIDAVATKGTEMGVSKFIPVLTKRTVVDKINRRRFELNIKEACEQCERNDVPALEETKSLDELLTSDFFKNSIIIICDETGGGKKISELLMNKIPKNSSVIVLIGPEGGWSNEELAKFQNAFRLSLGSRILKVDTAIVAAMALINEYI